MSMWREVQGGHGVGSCNEAGERFLEICVVNGRTITNTWFEKPQRHLATPCHQAVNLCR